MVKQSSISGKPIFCYVHRLHSIEIKSTQGPSNPDAIQFYLTLDHKQLEMLSRTQGSGKTSFMGASNTS